MLGEMNRGLRSAYRQVTAERSGLAVSEAHWVMKMPWADWETRMEGRAGMREDSATWNASGRRTILDIITIIFPSFCKYL